MAAPRAFISLFADCARDRGNVPMQCPMHPPLKSFAMEINAKPNVSNEFPRDTRLIEIHCEADAFVEIGNNPNGGATNLIREGERLVYGVLEGMRISVREAD